MRAPASHRAERGGPVVWLAAFGLALILLGLAVPGLRGQGAPTPGALPGAGVAAELPPYVVEPVVRLEQAVRTPAAAAGVPRRLVVPDLGIDARVVPIGLVGATLVPPSDPQQLGWWSGSARAGVLRGGTVITGHTVHSGGGAMDDLETLRRGDPVRVRTDRGAVRYVVTGVTVYRKASLAQAAERIFGQAVPHRLVLVTCEDWNGTEYLSNAVVFADPRPGQ
ncbi:MAG TPA: class F sortase [Nocardioidaceae bacterium]